MTDFYRVILEGGSHDCDPSDCKEVSLSCMSFLENAGSSLNCMRLHHSWPREGGEGRTPETSARLTELGPKGAGAGWVANVVTLGLKGGTLSRELEGSILWHLDLLLKTDPRCRWSSRRKSPLILEVSE